MIVINLKVIIMTKYNWTIDTLQERLILIEKLIKNETDPKKLQLLKKDYYELQKHIDDYYDRTPNEKMKLLETFQYLKKNLNQIEFLWLDFQEFARIVNKPIFVPDLKKCSLSKTDLLDITHDFYKSLNKFFFGNFMKNFYRRNDHIVFRGDDNLGLSGTTLTLSSLKESFIEIFRHYTFEDILTTIHEYSHATSASINPKHLDGTKSLYSEIDSIFMELIASDYIDSLFKDDFSTIFKAEKLYEYCDNASKLSIIIGAIEDEPKAKEGYVSNKQLKHTLQKEFAVIPDEVDFIIDEQNKYSPIYLTSYMFALELYRLYKEDKEKALYYLKKIILLEDMSEYEYYCNIKRFGIIPNLSLQSHYKEIKRDALKLTRKKSNF